MDGGGSGGLLGSADSVAFQELDAIGAVDFKHLPHSVGAGRTSVVALKAAQGVHAHPGLARDFIKPQVEKRARRPTLCRGYYDLHSVSPSFRDGRAVHLIRIITIKNRNSMLISPNERGYDFLNPLGETHSLVRRTTKYVSIFTAGQPHTEVSP
jgi:hypothetical protein